MNAKYLWHRIIASERSLVRRLRAKLFAPNVTGDLNDATIVFVIASPRSGTTWLQRAFNEHPDISCGEHRLFGSYFDVIQDNQANRLRITLDEFANTLARRTVKQDLAVSIDAYTDELTAEFARTAFEKWRQHSGKSILVDKVTPYPGTSEAVVQKIQKLFPQAHIIQLVRDGRDVLTSGVFHWLKKSANGAQPTPFEQHRRGLILDGQPLPPLSRFFTDDEIRLWSGTWSEPLDALQKYGPDDSFQIRYEDMITDQSDVLRRICERVGADSSQATLQKCVKFASFKHMSGGRQTGQTSPGAHVRKGIIGDWKNYFTRDDAELFDDLCGCQMKSTEYESTNDWVKDRPLTLEVRKAS